MCTFTCASGNFSPTTAIFGLKTLPHIFSQLTDLIFQDIKHKFIGYYRDDILIFSEPFTSHKEHIAEVLRRLCTTGLTAEPKKGHIHEICVPIEFRLQIMKSYHDIKTSEHVGTFKMYNKAATIFYRIGMYSDMRNYVSRCRLCMQTKTGHPPKVALQFLFDEHFLKFGFPHLIAWGIL